jgi:hypothetical protein
MTVKVDGKDVKPYSKVDKVDPVMVLAEKIDQLTQANVTICNWVREVNKNMVINGVKMDDLEALALRMAEVNAALSNITEQLTSIKRVQDLTDSRCEDIACRLDDLDDIADRLEKMQVVAIEDLDNTDPLDGGEYPSPRRVAETKESVGPLTDEDVNDGRV